MDGLWALRSFLPAWAWEAIALSNGLLLLAALFVPLEARFALHRSDRPRTGLWSDVGWYFINNLSLVPLLGVSVLALVTAQQHLAPQGLWPNVAQWPDAMRFVAALVVAEVGFYWGHRWVHANAWLWRFHAVHHAADRLDWLVNVRAHPLDMVVVRLCGVLPLVPLGLIQPTSGRLDWVPVAVTTVSTLWGYVIHANLRWRLGWLENVLATPHFHHGHHDGTDTGRGHNFAPSLPLLDRAFGTLRDRHQPWPARYGVADRVAPALVDQLFAPLFGRWPRADARPPASAPRPRPDYPNQPLRRK